MNSNLQKLIPLFIVLFFGLPAESAFTQPSRSQDTIVVRPQYIRHDTLAVVESWSVPRPGIVLVLSGGGARGACQIGVLRVLERNHIPINGIVGTSIGAIIGGLYALGYTPDRIENVMRDVDWNKIFSFNDEIARRDMFVDQRSAFDRAFLVLRFSGFEPIIPSGVITGQRFTDLIQSLVLKGLFPSDSSFDALRLPYRAVATDLRSGRRIVFDRGDPAFAMRSSATLPILFTPIKIDSMELVDGGLVANIPVDVGKDLNLGPVIAVDNTSRLRTRTDFTSPIQAADQIIDIMMQFPNRAQRVLADLVVTPDLGFHSSTDFSNLDSLIHAGGTSMEAAIPAVRRILDQQIDRISDSSAVFKNFRIQSLSYDLPESERALINRRNSQPTLYLSQLQSDVNSLYASGRYRQVSATIAAAGDSTSIGYSLTPNPLLRRVILHGCQHVDSLMLLKYFQPMLNRPVNTRLTRAATDSVLFEYHNRGYVLAAIDTIQFLESTGIADIFIEEGMIADIRVTGNTTTRDWVIRREFPIEVGDIFELSKANQGLRNIAGSNLFELVSLEFQHDASNPHQNIIILHVSERYYDTMRFALYADAERYAQPIIDARNENIFGTGMQIGLTLSGGLRNQLVRLEQRTSRIFNSYLNFQNQFYFSQENYYQYTQFLSRSGRSWKLLNHGEFRQSALGVSFLLGGQLSRLGNISGEFRVERLKLFSLDSAVIDPVSLLQSSLRFSSVIDTRDRVPYPATGTYLQLAYEFGSKQFGSEASYSKFLGTYESYFPIGEITTFHPHIVVGFADRTLPYVEQFALGGFQSFYGLPENAFRGRQLFVTSAEFRTASPFRIFFDTYLALRYDLGTVWNLPSEIKFKDLRHGFGFKLGFDTQMGAAEFGIGRAFELNKNLKDDPISFGPYQLYFSLGIPLRLRE